MASKLSAECGFDLVSPGAHPLYLNLKVGFRENVLSPSAPAVQLGFFNFGTRAKVTNQNVVYLTIGKNLPNGRTRLAASAYHGNAHVFVSGAGENLIGGGGIGVYYYFTKDVSILTGPVWFNDKTLNGPTKMTVQLDVSF